MSNVVIGKRGGQLSREKLAPDDPCRHQGEPTNQSATVVCITCQGRQERYYPIHACAIFGECLPLFQCTQDSKEALAEWMEKEGRTVEIQPCRGCERREPLIE